MLNRGVVCSFHIGFAIPFLLPILQHVSIACNSISWSGCNLSCIHLKSIVFLLNFVCALFPMFVLINDLFPCQNISDLLDVLPFLQLWAGFIVQSIAFYPSILHDSRIFQITQFHPGVYDELFLELVFLYLYSTKKISLLVCAADGSLIFLCVLHPFLQSLS